MDDSEISPVDLGVNFGCVVIDFLLIGQPNS